VHLDWHIGHYVKVLLDEVFGEDDFIEEIVWSYGSPSGGRAKTGKLVKNHDYILHYAMSYDSRTENKIFLPYSQGYIDDWFKYTDEKGRRYRQRMRKGDDGINFWEIQYLDESPGIPLSTVWTDVLTVYADPRAYTGAGQSELDYEYTTQKPEALVSRIVQLASDPGMTVADFFCGSGPMAAAAHKLGRRFIACDIGITAVQTTRDRLSDAGASFDVLKIQDGIRLFRNPAQTLAKIFSLVEGFKTRKELELGEFWDGGLPGASGRYIPIKFVGFQERLTPALLDVYLEEIYQLEANNRADGVRIIYAHRDLAVEGDDHQDINAGPLDQLDFLRSGGNQANALGAEDLERMGIKSNGNTGSLVLTRPSHHMIKEFLMAQMHPVKVSDGDMGANERMLDCSEVCIYFHGSCRR
jgi:adenine-specific DNA-methyltransferase